MWRHYAFIIRLIRGPEMARAQDQAKWLKSSGRKRVEAPLHAQTVDKLDRLAASRGISRAQAITELVEAAPEPGGAPAKDRDDETRDVSGAAYQPDDNGEAKATSEPTAVQTRPQPRYQATTRRVLSGRNYRTVDAYRVRARQTELGTVWTDPGSGSWRAVAADDDGYVLAKAASRREVARRLVDYAMRQGWI